MGQALQRLERHDEAAHELAAAVEFLSHHVNDSTFAQSVLLGELAKSQEQLGMVLERTSCLQRIVTLARDLGPNVPYAVHLTRMQAMEKLADIMGRDPTQRHKGISLLASAAELASDLAAKGPTDRGFTSAMAYLNLGQAQAEAGDHAEAATNLQYAVNALDVLAELTPEDDPNRLHTQGIQALALISLGDSCRSLEQWDRATTFLDRAVGISHTMTEQSPGEPRASCLLVLSLRRKAVLLEQTDGPAEATIALDDALRNAKMMAQLTASDEEWAEATGHVLGITLREVAALHERQDRTEEAIECYEQALEYWKLRHTRHPDHLSTNGLVDVGVDFFELLIKIGLDDRAEQVMAIVREALDQEEDDTQA